MLWYFRWPSAHQWLGRRYANDRSAAESIGLRIRGSGVRISPSAPALKRANKGFLAVSPSFYMPVSCCKALRADTKEISGLQSPSNHSTQHGRNIPVRFPFAFAEQTAQRRSSGV